MPTLTTTTLGRFCREIAGGLSPLPVLLEEWDINPRQFEAIQASKAYRDEMLVVVREMQDLGADAGYVYRMKSLSEEFLSEVIKIAQDESTTPSLKFDIIKWCAEMARLKEKPAAKNDAAQVYQGPSVVFQFGAGLPVQSMKVVGQASEEEQAPQQPPTSSLTFVQQPSPQGFIFDETP